MSRKALLLPCLGLRSIPIIWCLITVCCLIPISSTLSTIVITLILSISVDVFFLLDTKVSIFDYVVESCLVWLLVAYSLIVKNLHLSFPHSVYRLLILFVCFTRAQGIVVWLNILTYIHCSIKSLCEHLIAGRACGRGGNDNVLERTRWPLIHLLLENQFLHRDGVLLNYYSQDD